MTRGKPKDGSKNPGGRPVEWTEERIDALADDLDTWSRNHDALFLSTWLGENDLYWDLLPTLRKRSDKFSETEKKARVRLESHLAQAGAIGEIDKAITCFALKQGPNGWTDKREVGHSGGVAYEGKLTLEIDLDPIKDILNGG